MAPDPSPSGPAGGAPLRRLLAACRGGASLRLVRWAREAGVEVVTLVAPADGDAEWPEAADFASFVPEVPGLVWPAPERVVAAAMDAGCDLVHPGWSELARNPSMVDHLALTSLAWAGSGVRATGTVSDRAISREHAVDNGIPVVPGSLPASTVDEGMAWVDQSGLPVIVKPVDVVQRAGRGVATTRAEALRELEVALEHGPVLVERHVVGAREVEVPLLMDDSGACWTLGDREVGTRGRWGRLVVESPAPAIDGERRAQMHAAARSFATSLRFRGLGSARFLVPEDGRPYFLQLRPGLQPWHGVTERRFGVDLVDAQVRVAMGEGLGWTDAPEPVVAAALWAGLYSASSGEVRSLRCGAAAARLERGVVEGDPVRPGELVGSLTVAGPTRTAALVLLRAASQGVVLEGAELERGELDRLIDHAPFWRGPLDRDRAAALLTGASGSGIAPGERAR